MKARIIHFLCRCILKENTFTVVLVQSNFHVFVSLAPHVCIPAIVFLFQAVYRHFSVSGLIDWQWEEEGVEYQWIINYRVKKLSPLNQNQNMTKGYGNVFVTI